MQNQTALLNRKEYLSGVLYELAAFTVWGFLPLYWKVLKQVSPLEILAHRIFWSFVFVSILLFIKGRWKQVNTVDSRPVVKCVVILSALLISANWFTYIWAVNNNHVVEASLGYYINPLFTVFLGMLILRERLNFWQLLALVLAFIGVAVLTISHGRVPWIALILALTFGLYGLTKKVVSTDSLTGLVLETAVIAPVALGYIFYANSQGTGAFMSVPYWVIILLIGSGVVTALPLLWFALGAKKVPLSTVGFIQYLAPTISLFLGVIVFNEPFTMVHGVSFGFIWSAVLLYSLSHSGLLPSFYSTESGSAASPSTNDKA